jgi:hypothetical protein
VCSEASAAGAAVSSTTMTTTAVVVGAVVAAATGGVVTGTESDKQPVPRGARSVRTVGPASMS